MRDGLALPSTCPALWKVHRTLRNSTKYIPDQAEQRFKGMAALELRIPEPMPLCPLWSFPFSFFHCHFLSPVFPFHSRKAGYKTPAPANHLEGGNVKRDVSRNILQVAPQLASR